MNALTRMAESHVLHAQFAGPIVMIGFGSIGRGVLPLLERHIGFDRSKFVVIDPVDTDRGLLDERNLRFERIAITKDNIQDTVVKDGFLKASDICTAEFAKACDAAGVK